MTNITNFFFVLLLATACSIFSFAQTTKKILTKTESINTSNQAVKTTAAYAEVLLRKTELIAELEELLVSYNEEYPKVIKARFESDLLQKDMTRLLAVNGSEISKLTSALGKLLVRKAELETNLWDAQRLYGNEHPNVKRAKRKVEIFEQAIKEILP